MARAFTVPAKISKILGLEAITIYFKGRVQRKFALLTEIELICGHKTIIALLNRTVFF
jgi:hypothetical protein